MSWNRDISDDLFKRIVKGYLILSFGLLFFSISFKEEGLHLMVTLDLF